MPEVPPTLTLEHRAALAMNAVVGLADPDLDGVPFFSADLLTDPATLKHGNWDYGSSHGRLTDACVLARHMTGREDWKDTEERYRERMLGYLADDGLSYRRTHPRGDWRATASLIDQRATLLALTTCLVDHDDPVTARAAARQVAALHRIAVKERDAWYYPASEYTGRGWPSPDAVSLHLAPDPASFCGRLVMPLLRYHQATGSEQALELCGWFTRLIVHRSGVFREDGSFDPALAYRSGHFHTRIGTLEGLARYALHTGDHELTAFVVRSYDWVLGQATRFGWTPGDLAGQRYEHETCSLVDMIGVGTVLARAGYRRYWEVVERFLRNHLAESQLTDLGWVRSAPDTTGDEPGWRSHVRVGERVLGAFAGYGAPNDYVSDVPLGRGHTDDVQACCVGSGVRGLFTGWNNVVAQEGPVLRVNLLLNRAHHRVVVRSRLPFEGRIELELLADVDDLRLRVPGWAGYNRLGVVRTRPGSPAPEAADGRDPALWASDGYLRLCGCRAGERVEVRFPVPEHRTDEDAAGQRFEVTWRGDDVARISPPGRIRPMYADRPDALPPGSHECRVPSVEWAW